MADAPLIGSDHFCVSCGYNLRGLPLDRNCPECGEPACHTVRFTVRMPHPMTQADVRLTNALADEFRSAAESVDLQPSALRLVYTAYRYAAMTKPGRQFTARDVCAALRDYSKYHFGGEANAIFELAERQIRDSEDVGRIIYAMVAGRIIQPSQSDSQSDFEGLFTLDNLFSVSL